MANTNIALSDLGTPTYARVCDQLRVDILSGRFQPAARLRIAELSKMYGVSQMPIREALQKLQGEGLIVISPNRGASVRTLDGRLVRNIYDVRGALDALLVERCVPALTDTQMLQLYGIESQYEAAVERGDLEATLEQNKRLHGLIYSLGQNPEAQEVVERYSSLLDCLRKRYGFREGRMRNAISEHRDLLRALNARDTALASRIAREHCSSACDDLLALLRS